MIRDQNLHFVRQGRGLLRRLDPEVYAAAGSRHSSVGAHLRHCIDYYRCFLDGLDGNRIDYDARQREAALETDPATASAALEDIARRLEAIEPQEFGRVVEVKVDTPADAPDAWSRSTVARELQFLVSHTVHHYALIAHLLREQGIEPGDELGVAPSTLEYRKSTQGALSR